MKLLLIILIIGLRFLLPVLLMMWPFFAGWANFFLDSFDGDILLPLGLDDYNYQTLDKFADYFTYIMMLVVGRKLPIKKEIYATFILRSIGQILFLFTRNELMLFFFPNLLEPLFLIFFTLTFRYKSTSKAYRTYFNHRWKIWAFIGLYKFQDEWITHVGNIDRSNLIKYFMRRT